MSNGEREPDPSRRSDRARQAILDATRDLIRDVGYDRMTIEGIAARAGVGKQTIYRWWKSKAFVVLEMWGPTVTAQLGFPDTGDLRADLVVQLRAVIDLANDPVFGPSFRALVADSQHDEVLAAQLCEQIFWPRIAACKERLRLGQAAGQLSADADLDILVDLLFGGFYHRYLLRVAPLSSEAATTWVQAALAAAGSARLQNAGVHDMN